jgi:hypothetical protein
MAARLKKQELLRELARLAEQIRTEDGEILTRVAQCPSAKNASALLAHALAEPASSHACREQLLPPASWLHPFI